MTTERLTDEALAGKIAGRLSMRLAQAGWHEAAEYMAEDYMTREIQRELLARRAAPADDLREVPERAGR